MRVSATAGSFDFKHHIRASQATPTRFHSFSAPCAHFAVQTFYLLKKLMNDNTDSYGLFITSAIISNVYCNCHGEQCAFHHAATHIPLLSIPASHRTVVGAAQCSQHHNCTCILSYFVDIFVAWWLLVRKTCSLFFFFLF